MKHLFFRYRKVPFCVVGYIYIYRDIFKWTTGMDCHGFPIGFVDVMWGCRGTILWEHIFWNWTIQICLFRKNVGGHTLNRILYFGNLQRTLSNDKPFFWRPFVGTIRLSTKHLWNWWYSGGLSIPMMSQNQKKQSESHMFTQSQITVGFAWPQILDELVFHRSGAVSAVTRLCRKSQLLSLVGCSRS